MTSLAEYNRMMADQMSELQLQLVINAAAPRFGWLIYHTHDSRRSQPGFPDLVLLHPGRGELLFRELKTSTGKLRPEQATWLDALKGRGNDAAVWRPIQWFDQTITKILAGTDE